MPSAPQTCPTYGGVEISGEIKKTLKQKHMVVLRFEPGTIPYLTKITVHLHIMQNAKHSVNLQNAAVNIERIHKTDY